MREMVCSVVGVIGSALCYFFGGWDAVLIALTIFMLIDLLTGVAVAVVFHKSPKNENGKLESKQFLKGVVKKICVLMLVGVAHILDMVLTINFIRTAVVFAFITNEVISIIENCGLMGIPIPSAISKGLELIAEKVEQ